ncbi:MAG: endonuclease III, partial [Thermoplasmata archaeon]
RKTANVVLSTAYSIDEGIACDTHVIRVSRRLGLSSGRNSQRIEQDLMNIYPKKQWGMVSHLFIAHGRTVCDARKPKCFECILFKYCLYPTKESS